MSDWDPVVEEWLVSGSACYAGALGNGDDGVLYSAAAGDNLDAWTEVYKEDYEIDAYDDDGNISGKKTINEGATIKAAIDTGTSPDGVWIGGTKYKIVSLQKEFNYNDASFDCCFLARPKGGCHLIKTPNGCIIVGLFDEEKNQSSGNSRTACLAFAEYMNESGF